MDIENKKRQINKIIDKLNSVTHFRIMRYVTENKLKYTKKNNYFLINLSNYTEKNINTIYDIIFNDNFIPISQNIKKQNNYSWLDKIAI